MLSLLFAFLYWVTLIIFLFFFYYLNADLSASKLSCVPENEHALYQALLFCPFYRYCLSIFCFSRNVSVSRSPRQPALEVMLLKWRRIIPNLIIILQNWIFLMTDLRLKTGKNCQVLCIEAVQYIREAIANSVGHSNSLFIASYTQS